MSTRAVSTQVEAPAAGTWEIDPVHSAVTFAARHLMVSKVRGGFRGFRGTLHVSDVPEQSWVEVEIDAASIDTGEAQRDAHLRSPDFLDAERFPALTFRGTEVERTGERTLRVRGDLTIRDVTRPVDLDVEYLGVVADPWGGTRAGFTASTEIDREDFGVTWNQLLEAGGVVVSRKIRIELEVEATRA